MPNLQSIHYKLSQRTSDHPQYKILFGRRASLHYYDSHSFLQTHCKKYCHRQWHQPKPPSLPRRKRAGATDYLSWYWPKSPTQMLWQVLLILFHFVNLSPTLLPHVVASPNLTEKTDITEGNEPGFKSLFVQFYNRWNTDYYDFNQSLTSSIHTSFHSHYFLLIFF